MRFLRLLALLCLASPLAAQDTTAVKALTVRQKVDADSIYRRTTSTAIRRQATRIKSRADSIVLAIRPLVVVPPPTPVSTVAKVYIHSNGSTLTVGQTLQLIAQPVDTAGVTLFTAVAWSVAPSAVADISGLGLLTAKSAGTATVSATSGGVTGTRDYPIAAAPVPPPAPLPDTTTTTPPPTSTSAIAEPPRVRFAAPYPVGGRPVNVGSDLQAAMNAAVGGDVLLLNPCSITIGNFVIPNRPASDSAYIVLRTNATLPAEGTRMTPSASTAACLAKIQTPSNASTFVTAPGAHHWRLVGVEIGGTATAQEISGIVRFGTWDASEPTVASMAHHLVLDRVYVHGTPTQAIRRCVFLSSAATIVKDSWLANCHSNNGDSQAILGLGGAGPYTIDNNTLSGGHEVVMFGGGDPIVPNLVASDITITRNDITRPTMDRGVWQVKNLLELKSAKRVLIQANVMHNNWTDAQTGYGLLIKSVDQDGTCSACGSTDITVVANILKNTGAGINLAGKPEYWPVAIASRITLTDNLIDSVNVGAYPGLGIPLELLDGVVDVVLTHNTFTRSTGNTIQLDNAPMVRLNLTANAFAESGYGVKGSDTGTGTDALQKFAPGYVFAYNVNAFATCSWYPATTLCPSSWPATMPLAPDGKPIGADLARVTAATAGVVVSP